MHVESLKSSKSVTVFVASVCLEHDGQTRNRKENRETLLHIVIM
jgi:hypothetical protein